MEKNHILPMKDEIITGEIFNERLLFNKKKEYLLLMTMWTLG